MNNKLELKQLGRMTRTFEHDNSLTTDDIGHWDHDTRKTIVEAVKPIVQEDIQERMKNPMAALHGIVEELYANRDVLDSQRIAIRKLRFAYNGLASALEWHLLAGRPLGQERLYPTIKKA